jgi:hypothetical protein
MKRPLTLRLLPLAVWLAGASAQEAPRYFQLILPDFFDTPFEGGSSAIDLPDRPVQRLKIVILQASERNITASSTKVWVNGKGMGNVLDSRGVAEGIELIMDPLTLRRRPDELFDARENTIEVVATDRRGRKYYQSWILRAGGNQNPYFTYTSTVSPDDPRGVPPDLILESPTTPVLLAASQKSVTATLKGTVASTNLPVAVTLNGKPWITIQRNSEPFTGASEVSPTTKELILEATDSKHNIRRVIMPVIVRRPAQPVVRFAGTRYALIIGVSRYGPAKDAPPLLPYAAADATELAHQLETTAGFRHENIRLMVDDQATLSQIRTGLYDFVSKATANDLMVVYIAAHGVHDPHPGRGERIYLAPYGTQLAQIDSTALSFEDVEMLLGKAVRCNHTFILFDVGHKVEGDWKFPGRNMVNNHLLNLFSEQEGRAILVSGAADEVSQARSSQSSGAFPYWTTRGLTGEADLNQDRVVTAEELFRFVSEKVREDTGGTQNPRYRLPEKTASTPVAEVASK